MQNRQCLDATYICGIYEDIKDGKSSKEKDDAILNLMAQAEQTAMYQQSALDTLNLHYQFLGEWCGKEDAHLSFVRDALFQNSSVLDVLFYHNPNELELVVVAEQADASTYDFVSGVLTRYEDIFRHGGTYVLLTSEQVRPADISSAWKHYKNRV